MSDLTAITPFPPVTAYAAMTQPAMTPGMTPATGPYMDPMGATGFFVTGNATIPTAYYSQPAYAAAPSQFVDPLTAIADALMGTTPAAPQIATLPATAASPAAPVAPTGGGRRSGHEIWAGIRNPRTVHVTQVQSRFNANPTPGGRDCGPASVLMALRMVGLAPSGNGKHGSGSQQLISKIRSLASAAIGQSTSNFDLERALSKSGAQTTEVASAEEIRAAVTSGSPVVLNGNPRNPGAYGPRFSASALVPYNGAHWIVVSGLDEATGQFIVNDPLSRAGAFKVSAAELEAYRGGSLGITVSR